jgi:dienelactone hydrolase
LDDGDGQVPDDPFYGDAMHTQHRALGATVEVVLGMGHGFVTRGDFTDTAVKAAADAAMSNAVAFVRRATTDSAGGGDCCPAGSLPGGAPSLNAGYDKAGTGTVGAIGDLPIYTVGSGDTAVIVVYDIYGDNESTRIRNICDELAAEGHQVSAGNASRSGRGVLMCSNNAPTADGRSSQAAMDRVGLPPTHHARTADRTTDTGPSTRT